ncbi:MAG: peptidase [Prochlorococcaceae cyanobacterium]
MAHPPPLPAAACPAAAGLLLLLLLLLLSPLAAAGRAATDPAATDSAAPDPCPPLLASRPLPAAPAAAPAPQPAAPEQPIEPAAGDYRHRLNPSPHGWVHRSHWCIWLQPAAGEGASAPWDERWHQAVRAALAQWQELLPITLVTAPERAQVHLYRRRPPLRSTAGGMRASHGRAELSLRQVQRPREEKLHWQPEPLVEVMISPGQHQRAIQATALHELGHAFGLWGHSDQAGDAMAAVPGAMPVLTLSPRDRATLRWLRDQPSLFKLEAASP